MDIILKQDGLAIENYSALVAYAKEQTTIYEGLVVEESAITAAKKDTAGLRKQAKEADRIRIDLKKANEARIKEVTDQLLNVAAIYNGAADCIDKQVKVFEEKAKAEKLEALKAYFEKTNSELFAEFEMVFEPKMLNKTYSLADAKAEIDRRIKKISEDLDTIKSLGEFSNEMTVEYLRCLNLGTAIAYGNKLKEVAKRNEQACESKPEPKMAGSIPVIDIKPKVTQTWVITATETQFEALRKFCVMQGIAHSVEDPDSIFG